jgi:thiamine-monophosphate kinase
MNASPTDSTTTLSLGDYGERRLIGELLQDRYGQSGRFGDDCAVLPGRSSWPFELVATTDPCPEPLVASLGWSDLYYQGWLLGTINFSDLAAAGADPLGLLVSYLLPPALAVEGLNRLLDGVDDCCRAHGTQVVGGNLSDASAVQLTGTAIGVCPLGERLSRRGARPGDRILLVGSPGYLWGAVLLDRGHARLSKADTDQVIDRARRPVAQLAAGRALAESGLARAAVDVSDGLYASIQALCAANQIGAIIEPERCGLDPLPREICRQSGVDPFALAQLWGDWTLVVAVGGDHVAAAIDQLAALDVRAQDIGYFTADSEKSQLLQDGVLGTWHGVDAERFTGASWTRSKIPDYVEWLLGSRPS